MISRWNRSARAYSSSRRGAVAALAEDFDQHAGRLQAGHPRQVDGTFGMARPAQHAAFLGHQRVEMARADEVGRLAVGIEDFADRLGPLRRGDAGAAMAVIDRHGEGGAQRRGIVFDDRRQVQPVGHLGQDGHAKLPPPVGDHEIDDFGRDPLGRADEIALVFAVLVVHRDDDAAGRDGLDGRFDGRKPVGQLSLLKVRAQITPRFRCRADGRPLGKSFLTVS